MNTLVIDAQRAEQFGERILGMVNNGCVSLMVSIGHRTGLFDRMAGQPPASSQQIADATGLHERYVREWLGAMTTSGIVEYDEPTRSYRLPPEHAACLTRDAAPNNLAAFAQYVSVLGSVEDQIVECFRHGGGVPYSAFPRFQQVMSEDSGQTVLPALFDHILPLVPGLHERLAAGIDVLEIGCGLGKALTMMARAYPESRFTGVEISQEAVNYDNRVARDEGLSNLRFVLHDAATFRADGEYDLALTFDAIHDQADPAAVLRNIHDALKPGGVYLMQDIKAHSHVHDNLDHPMGPLLYTVSCMHCMTVSLAEGGAGLGAMWGEELALEMLADAGFCGVQVHELAHDIQNQYYVSRTA